MTGVGAGTVVVMPGPEPAMIIRFLWFIAIGWWASEIAILAGWFLNLTVVGMPAGLYLLNRVPQIATLKPVHKAVNVRTDEKSGVSIVEFSDGPQRPFVVRAVYYVCVGWWLTFVWLQVAWVMGVLLITLPISFWMFGMTGRVMTLRR